MLAVETVPLALRLKNGHLGKDVDQTAKLCDHCLTDPQVLQKIVILHRSYTYPAPHRVSLSSMNENEDELRIDQDNDLTECVSAVIIVLFGGHVLYEKPR